MWTPILGTTTPANDSARIAQRELNNVQTLQLAAHEVSRYVSAYASGTNIGCAYDPPSTGLVTQFSDGPKVFAGAGVGLPGMSMTMTDGMVWVCVEPGWWRQAGLINSAATQDYVKSSGQGVTMMSLNFGYSTNSMYLL